MDFWNHVYFGNTLLDYAIVFGIILGSVLGAKLVYWISKNVIKKLTARTKSRLDDILIDKVEEPVSFGIVLTATWYALSLLNYAKVMLTAEEYIEISTSNTGVAPTPEQVEIGIQTPYPYWDHFVDHLFGFLVVVNITWLIVRIFDSLIEEYVAPLAEKTDSDLDDQMLPIFRKGMKVVVWVIGIIAALNNAGYDVGAIIAGLGIGGLAFALAAQDTMKNFFGGIMIFADKPFNVGDRIVVDGIDGSVTEIGIRSTRIQTVDGRQVTMPNSKFTDGPVENVSREPSRKVVLNLGLVYDTSPEQMEQALEILKKIGEEKQDKIEENVLMSFNAFGDFSLGILFVYYIRKEADILITQTEMNLEILKRFNTAGLEMAFPTQTIHHKAMA